jgi:hypothetical protein
MELFETRSSPAQSLHSRVRSGLVGIVINSGQSSSCLEKRVWKVAASKCGENLLVPAGFFLLFSSNIASMKKKNQFPPTAVLPVPFLAPAALGTPLTQGRNPRLLLPADRRYFV